MKKGLLPAIFLLLLALAADAAAVSIPASNLYGQVVLSKFSRKASMAPVIFDHWLHRAAFTCRLCHVDVGFAMKGGETGINAETNEMGYFCGACHDGKRQYEGRAIFASCSKDGDGEAEARCRRCHSRGQPDERSIDFETFAANFPKIEGESVIDWEVAEEKGLIKPIDYLEGVSIERPPLQPQADFTISSKADWMSDVIFSHKKHAVWNGCELCHPEIFASTKKGTAKYTMFHIIEGEFCGVCHTKVAFSIFLCQKCHPGATFFK